MLDDNGLPLPRQFNGEFHFIRCPHCQKTVIFDRKRSSRGILGPWEPSRIEAEAPRPAASEA